MDIETAISVIESVSGVTDNTTPIGEAWEVVLGEIYGLRKTPGAYMHTQESIQKAVDDIREVCKKHGIVLIGSDGSIDIVDSKIDAVMFSSVYLRQTENIIKKPQNKDYYSKYYVERIGEFI